MVDGVLCPILLHLGSVSSAADTKSPLHLLLETTTTVHSIDTCYNY